MRGRVVVKQKQHIFDWRHIYDNGFIHLPGFMFCIGATIFLAKLSSLLAPFSLYFTFTDLVKTGEGGYGPLPFLIKLLIPFAIGVCYFKLFKDRDAKLSHRGEGQRVNLELTASFGALFGALLLSWPAIVLWELIVSPAIYSYRMQFVLVYLLYMASFAWVSCAGVMAARAVWSQDESRMKLQEHLTSRYQVIHIVWSLIFALGTGGLAEWASKNVMPR